MNDKKIVKDLVLYFIGSAIPMILGFIRSPIYTRYFSPEQYGYFTIVNITFSYLVLVTYSGLAGCIWRYYNQYKRHEKLSCFYSNLLFLYVIVSVVMILTSSIWFIFCHNTLIKQLIIVNAINCVTGQVLVLYLIIVRLEGKSLEYNLITGISAAGSFIILLCLTFKLNKGIESMIESTNIVNIIFILTIVPIICKKINVSRNFISIGVIKEFIKYGFSSIICNISLVVLTSGDRYIIQLFGKIDSVGIYNQVYNLAQISISAFIAIFFNAINPYIYKLLEYKNKDYKKEMYNYINMYVVVFLPITVYFSLFSNEMSILLLGEKFRVGYKMMPFIMITSFVYGITQFLENDLMFFNKLKVAIKGFVIAVIINIILNFIFIPLFNYKWASVTTLVSYIVLYIYFYYHSDLKYFHGLDKKLMKRLIAVLFMQISLDLFIRKILNINFNVICTIAEGSIFLIVYYLLVCKDYLIDIKIGGFK